MTNAEPLGISHGVPCLVQELDENSVGATVRVLARFVHYLSHSRRRIIAYDAVKCLAVVEECIRPEQDMPKVDVHTGRPFKGEWKSATHLRLLVDTSLIDPFTQKSRIPYRFIGQVEDARMHSCWDNDAKTIKPSLQIPQDVIPKMHILLKPRIATSMDGLDLELWKATTKLTRELS